MNLGDRLGCNCRYIIYCDDSYICVSIFDLLPCVYTPTTLNNTMYPHLSWFLYHYWQSTDVWLRSRLPPHYVRPPSWNGYLVQQYIPWQDKCEVWRAQYYIFIDIWTRNRCPCLYVYLAFRITFVIDVCHGRPLGQDANMTRCQTRVRNQQKRQILRPSNISHLTNVCINIFLKRAGNNTLLCSILKLRSSGHHIWFWCFLLFFIVCLFVCFLVFYL